MLGEGFDVFAQEDRGPIWRTSYPDLETAKAKAQILANEEGREFFVFSFKYSSEVVRVFPKTKPVKPKVLI